MAKREIILDFHDPKLASAPPEAADVTTANEGNPSVAPDENPQLPGEDKVVEKKNH